jgi:pteridine reductase
MISKAALVTGASDRIGKGIALTLADMGFDIVLHYNNSKQKAEELKSLIEKKGRKSVVIQANFNKIGEVEQLFETANAFFKIDLVVNNASDFVPSTIFDEGTALLNHMMQVNFNAPFLLTKLLAQTKRSGAIINLLDTKISKNQTDHLDYILSKKALQALTLQTASSLGPQGIRVNAIAPGLILPPADKDIAYIEERACQIPLRKVGSLEAICDSVRFLVNSEFVTGQILYIDGGEYL